MRILILGGGFGGVYTTMALHKAFGRRDDIDIALIDQKNYFVFQPMLAEVISGSVDILHTFTPFRELCPSLSLYVGEVERIDLGDRVVIVNAGMRSQPLTISYDHLVLALGRVENFSVVRGLQEYGFQFKNLGDALVLRSRLISLLETADSEPDAETRRRLLTVVMAGWWLFGRRGHCRGERLSSQGDLSLPPPGSVRSAYGPVAIGTAYLTGTPRVIKPLCPEIARSPPGRAAFAHSSRRCHGR